MPGMFSRHFGLKLWAAGSNIKSGINTKRCLATLLCYVKIDLMQTYADNLNILRVYQSFNRNHSSIVVSSQVHHYLI